MKMMKKYNSKKKRMRFIKVRIKQKIKLIMMMKR
jgi:hypothetical protein